MPRKKKAIPSAMEGRASLSSLLEQCSLDAVELVCRLRKPYSLIRASDGGGSLSIVIDDLQQSAQSLSDLAVDVSLGRVAVAQAEPREVQTSLFDGIPEPSEN